MPEAKEIFKNESKLYKVTGKVCLNSTLRPYLNFKITALE